MARIKGPQQRDTVAEGRTRRIAALVGAALGLALFVWLFTMILGSQGCQRSLKSFRSDFGGGIERTVTLYDYNGDVDKFVARSKRLMWMGPTRAYISLGIDLFNRKRR